MSLPTDKPAARDFGLGRGLDALFSTPAADISAASAGTRTPGQALVEIPILHIKPNPQQPRKTFHQDKITALADSIRDSGLLHPLVVQPDPESPGAYLIIAGERRWQAAQLAGLVTVPAIVREATSQDALVLALVENLQRADLSPLEQAAAFLRLSTHYDLTHAQIAEAMGSSRSAVTNAIRLLGLPEMVQEALAREQITVGHARALLAWPTPHAQIQALQKILAEDLTVRQTEAAFLKEQQSGSRQAVSDSPAAAPAPNPVDELRLMERQLRAQLQTKVSIQRRRSGAGRVVLHFYDDTSLNQLLETLLSASTEL